MATTPPEKRWKRPISAPEGQSQSMSGRAQTAREGQQRPIETHAHMNPALMAMYGQPQMPMMRDPGVGMMTPGIPQHQMLGMDDGREASVGLDGANHAMVPVQYRSRITKEVLSAAMLELKRYKAGKRSTERRIIEAQEWWKLRNWVQIERTKGVTGSHTSKSNTAWLWNCIVGKHADAIDSYPEPVILPRVADDKAEAKMLSDIVPVVLAINGFEQTYNDAAWQKMLEGTGAYGIFWDKDKLGGLGDISIRRVNLLNLFWEPGVSDIQDSKNVFSVALMDDDVLVQIYPQLRGKELGHDKFVSEYRYDDNIDTTNKSLVVDWYYHGYTNGRKILHYCKFVGEHVLYATEDDPEAVQRGLYDDGLYPFVLDPLFPVEGSPAGFGYVHVGKDTQKDIDLISQAVVTNATMCATPRYFVRYDGSINEEEFADTTKPLVHVNGQLGRDSVMPVEVPSMPGNVMDVLTTKIDELKFVTGNTDINNGGVPSGVTAASAIAALKEDSGRSSKDSTRASYRAYAKIITMVIERIRQFYDMPRQFRITGGGGAEDRFVSYSNAGIVPQPQGLEFGVDMGFRLPAFDIDVRAQRETAYTRASQNELAIQMMQLGIFNPQMVDQSLMMLDMMDFKGKEELMSKVQRMGGLVQTVQQIGMITSQLAMQMGDAQTAQMIQQVLAAVGGAPMMPTPPVGKVQTPEGDNLTGNIQQKEHPFVQRAKEQVANATRPT